MLKRLVIDCCGILLLGVVIDCCGILLFGVVLVAMLLLGCDEESIPEVHGTITVSPSPTPVEF